MTGSWISSDFTPDTVAIRDDGAPAISEKKDTAGTVIQEALPERGAWPAGHYVHVRRVRSGGDLKRMRLHLNEVRKQTRDAGLPEQDADNYVGHEAVLANAAAYIVRLEGEQFVDPETCERDEDDNPVLNTGEPLRIEGTFEERLGQVERIPEMVLEFVFATVMEMQSADPLGIRPNGTGGPPKSRTSSPRPRSQRVPAR